MSGFTNKVFLQSKLPIIQCVRYRGKINIQRPQKPHYKRALFYAVAKPIYPNPPLNEGCFKNASEKTTKINPYNKIIARETYNWFEHSRMIGIFHLNSIKAGDLFKVRVNFFRENMHLKRYGNSIMDIALKGTKYEAVLSLLNTSNCLIFSPETNVKGMLKVMKKTPQMILLAGIYENRLLSKNEFTNLATISDITNVRAQFVGVLNSIGGNFMHNLQAQQMHLTRMLDFYAKPNIDEQPDKSDGNSNIIVPSTDGNTNKN